MRRRRTRTAGRMALAALVALLGGCTPLDDVMVSLFGRSMRDQPTFDPYEDPLTAPEGAVSFASGNFPRGPDDVNVGQPEALEVVPPPFTQIDVLNEVAVVVDLPNPLSVTDGSLARGEELFLRFCAPCHGANGDGVSGYIISAGYPPYPLTTDRVEAFTDGYIYGMIRVGRGNMPSYGHRISHFDRWHVVNYLRSLQGLVPASNEGEATASNRDGGSDSPRGEAPASAPDEGEEGRASPGTGGDDPSTGVGYSDVSPADAGHDPSTEE